jgi:hypothetical protein
MAASQPDRDAILQGMSGAVLTAAMPGRILHHAAVVQIAGLSTAS